MSTDDYEVVAAHDDKYCRIELRRYPDRWVMVRLRPKVGGGWYIRESMACACQPTNERRTDEG
jgi:hypothetical protein